MWDSACECLDAFWGCFSYKIVANMSVLFLLAMKELSVNAQLLFFHKRRVGSGFDIVCWDASYKPQHLFLVLFFPSLTLWALITLSPLTYMRTTLSKYGGNRTLGRKSPWAQLGVLLCLSHSSNTIESNQFGFALGAFFFKKKTVNSLDLFFSGVLNQIFYCYGKTAGPKQLGLPRVYCSLHH